MNWRSLPLTVTTCLPSVRVGLVPQPGEGVAEADRIRGAVRRKVLRVFRKEFMVKAAQEEGGNTVL